VAERYQDLLIRLRGAGSDGSYPVESEAGDGSRARGELRLDVQALLGANLDPQAYGTHLFEALFAGDLRQAYGKALGTAGSESGGRLRTRLWIEPEAAELHAVHWERLYHAPQGQAIPLATSALNPFSRYTALDVRDPAPVATRPIRLLFAVSNPTDLPAGLRPVDVDAEVRVLLESLTPFGSADRVRVTLLPGRTGLSAEVQQQVRAAGFDVIDGPTTFDTLTRLLGRHEIVHTVAHGFFRRDADTGEGRAAVYLEKDDGGWTAVPDADLTDRVAPLEPPLPHLVFLSACESARTEADRTHPFVGLGPKLVHAGVPAVVGMQAPIPAAANRELVGQFYRNLFEHGVVDLAMNQARLSLYRRRDVDWAIPVLFSRLRGGRLFVPEELANRVVTAEGILEETVHGALMTKSRPSGPERIPPPVRLLPRLPDLVGRNDEVVAATDSLSQGRPVEFHAPAGLGKTSLLRFLSYHPPASASDGVVYLARRNLPVDDLLEALFEATHTADGAYKPTPTQILQLLQDLRLIVAVDDADLTREDVQRLVDSAPAAAFLLASAERNLWGDGRAIELGGLSEDAALELFERELDQPVKEPDRAEVAALCRELEGAPLRIVQAAARVRAGDSVGDLRKELPGAPSLTTDERTVLAALTALDGAAIHPEHLAAATGLPDAPAILERLQAAGFAKTASPRFALAEPVEAGVMVPQEHERLLRYFIEMTERHTGDPGPVVEELEAILAVLAWAREQGRHADFLRLARAAEEALIVGRRWATWRSLLHQEVGAAEALGDEAARARALHQLGTQALGQDANRSAKRYLKEALAIRRRLGDEEGARVTRHNLKLLPTLLIPPFVMVTFLVLVVGSITVAGASLIVTSGAGPTLGLRSSPPRLDFGEQRLGTRTQLPAAIFLTGDPVIVADVTLSPNSEDFFVRTDCSGEVDAAGCRALVVFAPDTSGPHEADVLISYNGPKSPLRIHLSGVGLAGR
jgi:CHAT domain-containing protein